MKPTVRNLSFVFLASLLLSCNTVNLDDINSKLDSIDQSVGKAEADFAALNREITSLADMVDIVGRRLFITDISKMSGSIIITFSDGRTIAIQTGADGKHAPVIGIRKNVDGEYYWTLTLQGGITEWLKDDAGNKIRVNGRNGRDGAGVGGGMPSGKDGKDGYDGIIPVISIDSEGYWTVSYNSGYSFNRIVGKDGKFISALPYIEGGSSGYIFSGFKDNDETVELILVNGEVLEFEKFRELAIHFPQTEDVLLRDNITVLGFSLEGLDVTSHLETIDVGNIFSTIEMINEDTGYLHVIADGEWMYGSKVIVLLTNSRHTVTTVVSLSKQDDRIEKELGSTIIGKIQNHIPLYEGYTDLDISGTYSAESTFCDFSSTSSMPAYVTGAAMPAKYIRFGKSDKYGHITVECQDEGGINYGVQDFNIASQGNRFTAFAKLSRAVVMNRTTISETVAIVISGESTTEGIRNLKYCEYLEKKTYDPGPYLLPEKQFYVQSCEMATRMK